MPSISATAAAAPASELRVVDDHVGARLRKAGRDPATEAAARSGHDDDLAAEIEERRDGGSHAASTTDRTAATISAGPGSVAASRSFW